MKLLTMSNSKTVKGEKMKYLTGILHLAPADSSGVINVCPSSSAGCRSSCLNTAGRGQFTQVQLARRRKTELYANQREQFMKQLRLDIDELIRLAKKKGMRPAVRLNGTSDLPSLARKLAREYSQVQFYDYSAIPKPWKRTLSNYHLTFSRKEDNMDECLEALDKGVNVAMVFDTKKLPRRYLGYRVVNGDKHDLRFLDPKEERGVIVGLTPKGKAKRDNTGFVIKL